MQSSPVFECTVREQDWRAKIALSATAEARLFVLKDSGQVESECVLQVDHVIDGRRSPASQIEIQMTRQPPCRPELSAELHKRFSRRIQIAIPSVATEKSSVRVALLRDQDDLSCRMDRFKVQDLTRLAQRLRRSSVKPIESVTPEESK